MLILIKQLVRRGADSPPEVKSLGINPESIEQVEPHTEKTIDGPCVLLSVHGDRKLRALGTVEEIVRKATEAVWGPPREPTDENEPCDQEN